MTTAATIESKLILDASGFTSGMKKATSAADTFADKMSAMGKKMQMVGGMMTIGLTLPILAFGKAAVAEAAAGEAAITDLETVIKSTGAAAGVTSKDVQDYANKMQLLTKFSDDQIISGNAMLLTFTKIGKDIFPRASDATLDMAQKFGMDLSQASITLGKALNDPVSGVTALRRIGVMLTDEQEASVKGFMAVNDIASAQKIILDELAVEVGGVAQAYGTTFAGQVSIFNNRLDDMKEKIGVQLIPALIRLMEAATPLLNWFMSLSPAQVDLVIKILAVIAVLGPLTAGLGTVATTISAVSTAMPAVIAGFSTIATFVTGILIPAILAISAPVWLVIAAITALFLLWKNWDQLSVTVKQLGYIIKFYVAQAFVSLGSVIFKVINGIVKAWQTFVAWVQKPIKWPTLPSWLKPGSPTPFEYGLRGISSAMDTLSKKSLPEMNMGFNSMTPAMAGVGGGTSNVTNNVRFQQATPAIDRRSVEDVLRKTTGMRK